MSTKEESANASQSFGIKIKCPKCGCFVIPKDQNLAQSILQGGFGVHFKCPKCGCKFTYDQKKGEVDAIDKMIDTTSLFMDHKVDPLQEKLKKAQQLDAERRSVEALALLRECETEVRRRGNDQILQAILGNEAAALADTGEAAQAWQVLTEQKCVCERLQDRCALAQVLLNQGILMIRGLNKADEGIRVLVEGLKECKRAGMRKQVDQGLAVMRQITVEFLKPFFDDAKTPRGPTFEKTVQSLLDYAREFGEHDVARLASRALFILDSTKMIEGSL
ncbi:MAG: hypothetical protein NT105_07805 [Verrucomicrobia bacterium]|nr:hypothetical protein [Verrucomicrobiota bacterium]